MKVSELRIGNWIMDYNGYVQVVEISPSNYAMQGIKTTPNSIGVTQGNHYEPIPLTEEWLVKFGFEKIKNDFTDYSFFGRYKICLENGINSIYTQPNHTPKDWLISNDIKYVHQFQNIYFALTGEELILT